MKSIFIALLIILSLSVCGFAGNLDHVTGYNPHEKCMRVVKCEICGKEIVEEYDCYGDHIIWRDGEWIVAANLTLSDPLDPLVFYQVIDLDFASLWGTAVRIRGPAGGQYEYTSILELEVWGARIGDIDGSGAVDHDDFTLLPTCLNGLDIAPHPPDECTDASDTDGDNDVDMHDVAVFMLAFTG